MKNDAEEAVSNFYNTIGWESEGNITEDAKRWEDLREVAREYISKCRLRVLRYIPENGVNILDLGSGPIQYKEYLEYSRNFKKRYCIDLSSKALEEAKKKIGDHGVFLLGSFFDIDLDENFFDCAISLHVIYHMDKDKQEDVVRKLLRITKPGKPVIIVYNNPKTIFYPLSLFIKSLFRVLIRIKDTPKKDEKKIAEKQGETGYYFAYPIAWWDRFHDEADVKIMPWRSLTVGYQKRLMPDNKIGKKMFDILYSLEERFPSFFVKCFQYPMIILTKRNN